MADLLACMPSGTAKDLTEKQLRDFVKTLLFEKNLPELRTIQQDKGQTMPGFSLAIIKTIIEAEATRDTTKLLPLLNFALGKKVGVKRVR